ncbi:hypothetical protein [Micromonospora sp. WMMD737]|uniref:hypothetical protein n=1 Tax=Micromonospora sp. WMMD737 TaxID=3404113 RepID=UPI003B9248E3
MPDHCTDEGVEPTARAAAERVTFQLTYDRTPTPRRFEPGELTGPDIPCAYGSPITQSGGWEVPDDYDHSGLTEAEWIDRFAAYAVAEAVHEALEWFRVDGRPWLDPHGRAEQQVHQAVDELCVRLAGIRAGLPSRGED